MTMREDSVRWLLWIHVGLIISVWWIPLNAYSSLPNQIAVHFDAGGQPNRFDAKSGMALWLIPLVATLLSLGILLLSRFPRLYDFPQKNEVNRWPQEMRLPIYAVIKEMLLAVVLCLDVMWIFLEYGIVASARSGHLILSWTGVLVPAFAPLALAVYYINRVSRTINNTRRTEALTGTPREAVL